MDETNEIQLTQSNEILDLFGAIQTANSDMIIKSVAALNFPANGELRNNEMCFYKIKQLAFDEDYPSSVY